MIDDADIVVTGSSSPIGFQTEGGATWAVWDRYIAIDGKKAFHIGNVCGTCSFFFERLDGANRGVDVDRVASELNAGVEAIDADLRDALKHIMPDGRYRACLLHVRPTLVYPGSPKDYFTTEQVELWGVDGFSGLPHHPKTEYYRLGSRALADGRALHQFLVPTFPRGWLSPERVLSYASLLKSGELPTAVALTVLDVKQPAEWSEELDINSHWCLTHYLLDGHHKVFAASEAEAPCTLFSFLAVEQGVSSQEEIAELLRILEEA